MIDDHCFAIYIKIVSDFFSNEGTLLLLTTNMHNIPYSVLMQFPFGINEALYLKLVGVSSMTTYFMYTKY